MLYRVLFSRGFPRMYFLKTSPENTFGNVSFQQHPLGIPPLKSQSQKCIFKNWSLNTFWNDSFQHTAWKTFTGQSPTVVFWTRCWNDALQIILFSATLLERCPTDPLFKGSPRMCFLKTALENTLTKDAFQQLPLGILFKLFKSHGWENDDCPVTTTRDEGLSCHGCPVTENVGKNVLSRLGEWMFVLSRSVGRMNVCPVTENVGKNVLSHFYLHVLASLALFIVRQWSLLKNPQKYSKVVGGTLTLKKTCNQTLIKKIRLWTFLDFKNVQNVFLWE
jgi:hypothetical protein